MDHLIYEYIPLLCEQVANEIPSYDISLAFSITSVFYITEIICDKINIET